MTMRQDEVLARCLSSEMRGADCREGVICVLRDGEIRGAACGEWNGAPVSIDTPFLIASTSKLFITAIILKLASRRALDLDAQVVSFFGHRLDRLHVLRGIDMTGQITIRQLLSHSSGLADYFEGKRRDGTSLAGQIFANRDIAYGLDDVIAWVRDEMSPAFAPGTPGKAFYSDTNFYLLGEIISLVCEEPLGAVLKGFITQPLGLAQTRFFAAGDAALPLRLGASVLQVPKALASMPGDGGMISTARELALFARAFFDGRLFDAVDLRQAEDWRRLFFPLEAGLGVLRFRLPWFLPPFRTDMSFIGHSGISGGFVYLWPRHDMIFSGTVNQLEQRSRPYRLMVKAALSASKEARKGKA